MKYLALAFYRFVTVENPLKEVDNHKKFFKDKDITGRIYISEEGINGQMSGEEEAAKAYMAWLKSDPRFTDVYFKIHECKENIFPRVTVKYRKQLVALDEKVDVEKETAPHLSPQEWSQMLEQEKDKVVIDVRNDYEWKIGHFEGADLPKFSKFREFPAYAEDLKKAVDPEKTKVMMYCTGGIRCELYSALLKRRGFKNVYQLSGGIIGYGLEAGKKHWKGKLFVFDDRLAVDIDGKPSEVISKCHHCEAPSDTYYNCANMDCNNFFLSCPECFPKLLGCCSKACSEAPRLRPYERDGNKPFRRKHLVVTPQE